MAQKGDGWARSRLVDRYQGLVAHIASHYHCPGFEREDLLQEGVLGLLRALESFDPCRGCGFSTYATFWIRQGIQRSIDRTGRLIGLPVDLCHAVRNVEAARDRFVAERGYPPSLDELAEHSGVSRRRLSGLLSCLDAPVSLDLPVRTGEQEMACEIADPNGIDPQLATLREADRAEVREWLRFLPELDRVVIEGRYGLGGRQMTDEEFLVRHGLSREEVRRIERRAVRRLRGRLIGNGQGEWRQNIRNR